MLSEYVNSAETQTVIATLRLCFYHVIGLSNTAEMDRYLLAKS